MIICALIHVWWFLIFIWLSAFLTDKYLMCRGENIQTSLLPRCPILPTGFSWREKCMVVLTYLARKFIGHKQNSNLFSFSSYLSEGIGGYYRCIQEDALKRKQICCKSYLTSVHWSCEIYSTSIASVVWFWKLTCPPMFKLVRLVTPITAVVPNIGLCAMWMLN